MIPKSITGEILSPRSYGLIESVGRSRQEADGDDERELFFEICSEIYGGEYVKTYY
jgi:hypothetical protein